MFFTSAWCNGDEKKFRENIPFELLGQSIKRYHSTYKINVLMIYGYQHLSNSYISQLNSLGFNLIDYSEEFGSLAAKYPNLNKFYSNYERNCFLRWLAYKNFLMSSGKIDHFWHLDADIILHTSLDEIASDTKGKTFVLQGCPVLTSIADFKWFEVYENELEKLESNIIPYSNEAEKRRNQVESNDSRLCNVSLYRNPIGSDQDLLEYLIGAEIIMQDPATRIFDSNLYYIQNALANFNWLKPQVSDGNYIFEEKENKAIWIKNKKVPFIHYQGEFSNFSGLYYLISNSYLFRSHFIKSWLLNYTISKNGLKLNFLLRILYKIMRLLKIEYNRNRVIEMSLNIHNKQMNIINLLNFVTNNSHK